MRRGLRRLMIVQGVGTALLFGWVQLMQYVASFS
jgi:hypothetical protein